jgi:hypothetical protein
MTDDTEDKRPKLASVKTLPVKPKVVDDVVEEPEVLDAKYFAEYIREFAEDMDEAGDKGLKIRSVILIAQDDKGFFYTKSPETDGDLHLLLTALSSSIMENRMLNFALGQEDEIL